MDMHSVEQAIALLKASGYRVSKPRAKKATPVLGLNAIGKPYSPQYNPNYRMKYKPPSIARLLAPYNRNFMKFVGEKT